ncbi:MAG: hypothetical protein NTZ78_14495 [Candidatus Aureabacteria bacterium]|nr:hypothetical protein [Candidatus Auribacterota bacterium]
MQNHQTAKSTDMREALARTRAALDRARNALDGGPLSQEAPAPPIALHQSATPRKSLAPFLSIVIVALLGSALAVVIINHYERRLEKMSGEVTHISALLTSAQEAQKRESDQYARTIADLEKQLRVIQEPKQVKRAKFLGLF